MTALILILLLLLAVSVGIWVMRRSQRIRAEAADREARLLQELFVARDGGDEHGGQNIDVEKVFGPEEGAAARPVSTEEVLRAAGVDAELIALVKSAPTRAATEGGAAKTGAGEVREAAAPARVEPPPAGQARRPSDNGPDTIIPAPSESDVARANKGGSLRDLLQIFYEARGYHPVPAGQAARPIEMVLRHKSDPLRSYAFIAVREPVTAVTVHKMLERAKRIDQTRLIIAAEGGMAPDLVPSRLDHGVRVVDAAAMEAQLARLDFATTAKIRAIALKRSARRTQVTVG
jgi:hypothetical protein